MKATASWGPFIYVLAALMCIAPVKAKAEDIDIFIGSSAGSRANPKILIILDNSANWVRASQRWPGGLTQGQAEVRAINALIAGLDADVSLGVMEYATVGTASDPQGGFIRKSITPLVPAAKSALSSSLSTIFNNINSPDEGVPEGFGYGDLMHSALNYFSGKSTVAPSSSVLSSIADSAGYTSNYSTFKSPLGDDNACGRNFVIFIANNSPLAVGKDHVANGPALTALGGSISPQLPYQNYTASTSTAQTILGFTSACYSSLASCSTTDYAAACATGGTYDSCTCTNNTTTSLTTCAAGTQQYSVSGVTQTGGSITTTGPTAGAPSTTTGGVSACYVSSAAASTAVISGADKGGLSCPAGSVTTVGATTTTTTNSCAYSLVSTTPSTTATQNCAAPAGLSVLGVTSSTTTTPTRTTTACYGTAGGISLGPSPWVGGENPTDAAGFTCPATSVSVVGNTTTTTTYTCTYSGVAGSGCAGGGRNVEVTQTVTATPTSVTTTPGYKYDVQQVATPSVTTRTIIGGTSSSTLLGDTLLCYASGTDAITSAQFNSTCASYNGGCIAGSPSPASGTCSSGARFQVVGNNITNTYTATGSSYIPSDGANADEWARFLQQPNAKNAAASPADTVMQSITTYTIDVFNVQQNVERTALLQSMAKNGGGKYFEAKSEAAILDALKRILAEIQSVNSTFASASLPVSATNRTQNANQVFIGMFRPDPEANPRWFGNLKQYAIGRINGVLDLVDSVGKSATNLQTGFIDDCATSFWTTDSGSYWSALATPINPSPQSNCLAISASQRYSDAPDGPTVEKGGAAQVLRKGNNPAAATYTENRTMLTGTGSAPSDFTLGSGSLSNDLVNFTRGRDVNNDTGRGGSATTTTRPSIHGDIVHARPLPINYGDPIGVTVYYGANDGAYRAVDANTGKERWSYIAPEHYSKLQRLKDNNFPVAYPSIVALGIASSPKDYFFDGSTGVYQSPDGSTVWIFPTQRRGGRMMYAFDVSTPTSNPRLMWRHGCPNLTDDVGCTTGGESYSSIGQTWSTPNVAFVKGFSETTPVIVVGGGYDRCEDVDSTTKACGSAKGKIIYVINAETGNIIRSFRTLRNVAADVAMIDVDNDGFVDFGYALDTGGNVYRFDFVDSPSTLVTLSIADWKFRRVAYTNGSARKFLFQPSVFPTANKVFVAMVSGDRERPLIENYPYTSPVVNRAYVYKDDLAVNIGAIDMDDGSINGPMINSSISSASTCASTSLLNDSSKKGWFFDLTENGRGEQGVTAALIVAGLVTFSTNRPIPTSAASCSNALGEARGYLVNLFNGSGAIATSNNDACGGRRSSIFPGGGLPPSPVIGVVPVDGIPTAVLIGAPDPSGATTATIGVTKVNPKISNVRTRTYKSINTDQ